jgi:16S rRNA processing protein RimM
LPRSHPSRNSTSPPHARAKRRQRTPQSGDEQSPVAPAADAADHTPAVTEKRAIRSDPDPGHVAVGRVLAPFGLKGELKVQSLTDNEDRFAPKSKLWAGQQPVTVANSRSAGGHLYLTLKGYPDRSSIERFRGALLQVPESMLPALPEGHYYRYQLLGLTVVDREGHVIGKLDEIIETGANDVYRVRAEDGSDVLLPALNDVIISIDLEARRMVVDPPDWR